jgi:hypothetical protein
MITVVRSKDGSIKTFAERPFESYNLALGETMELIDTDFAEFAQRFTLTCMGRSGETITVRQGEPAVTVQVSCPGAHTVSVDVNGSIETLTPINGVAEILLGTDVPGTFIIQPADRALYCAAGNGLLVVEVLP